MAQVDLVAQRGNLLVLCEVKSHRRCPEEMVIRRDQQRRLVRAGRWLVDHWVTDGVTGLRIDVVSVEFPRRLWALPRFHHIQDCFGEEAGE